MPRLAESVTIGELTVPNRLYRAPLLECAGTNPDTANQLIAALEPAAAAGAGLIFQGASIVTDTGGCAAPNMTRVADQSFVKSLSSLTDRIHSHGTRIFLQLEHGGLRSRDAWHAAYYDEAPYQPAVSRPPWPLRWLDRLGFINLSPHIMSTVEVHELAAKFGRSAEWAVEAGYDGIHLAGANMGIIHQFLSPFYNSRTDEFNDGVRFLEVIHDEIRSRVGAIPLVTKVPAESAASRLIRPRLSIDDSVQVARRLEAIGFDAVVPVTTSPFWDASIIRGEYPDRSWSNPSFTDGYAAAFNGSRRARLIALGHHIQSYWYSFEPGWNESFSTRVVDAVDIPVLLEGGIRTTDQINRVLATGVCDAVGIGRPFYAEPRLPARLLHESGAAVVCENCNNCVVPQVTGAPGVCRTPSVLREHGKLDQSGAYTTSSE